VNRALGSKGRVLVTGAGGFIGRQCVPKLIARGFEVHAVTSRQQSQQGDGAWRRADLLDPDQTDRLLAEVQPEFLLHLAWYAVPGQFWTSPENLKWVEASLRLFRLFADRGGKRVVAAGSCAEYDLAQGLCIEHGAALRPNSLYGACKKATSELLMAYAAEAGLSAAWARVFFVYGPFEDPRRLVPSVITALLEDRQALCSHGRQIRDFLHVEDLADALVTLLESDVSGAINIGSGEEVTLQEIIHCIADELHKREFVRLGALASDPEEPLKIVADTRRLHSELCWRPNYALETGLRRTIDWWRRET
jgi:nucleoside-diphosphate-sugar epimerase